MTDKQDAIQAFQERYPEADLQELIQALNAEEPEDLELEGMQSAGYELIREFDAFCTAHQINYFAIVNTLIGAVSYQGFIPEDATLEVGMLRADYFKLENLLINSAAPASNAAEPFVLNAYLDAEQTARELVPYITLRSPQTIMRNGEILFDDKHLPLQASPKLRISIFDAVPADYDFARVLYYRTKRLNDQYKKASYTARLGLSQKLWKLAGSYNKKEHSEIVRLLSSRSKSVPLDEVFPLKKLPFGDAQISCPNITTTWVVEDSERELEQVKYLQEDALKITKEIDRVCRELGIGYFICGGTMLGYVRHGGFIPWDDDMDVGMLRADYEVFSEKAPGLLGDEFFLQTRASDPNIPYLFSKVRLRNTEYITKYNEHRDFDKGICVDIFPFDKAPVGTAAMKRMMDIAKEKSHAHNIVANRQVPIKGLPHKHATNPQELFFRAVMTARHKKYWGKSLAQTQEDYHQAVSIYNDDPSINYVASYVPTFTCVSLDDLLPYQDVEFEGVTLMAPKNPEVFLRMQYGDFMELPMPHQQQGHGLLRWKSTEHSSDEFA